MNEYKPKYAMTRAVVVSLALHAGLVLVALWLGLSTPPEHSTDTLRLELAGMIANRQREAQAAAPAAPQPPPPAQPPPKAPQRTMRKQAPQQDSHKTIAPSPVSVPEATAQTAAPAPATPAAPMTTQTPAAVAQSSGPPQVQTTLSAPAETQADALKEYMIALGRKLQANLVYPSEARKAGYEGDPVVKFTIELDGTILPGSLTIERSSGHPMLDANALRTAEASQPFERPSQRMEVAVAVAFRLTN